MNISRDFCILSLIRAVYLRVDYFRHLSRQNRPFEINFFHEKIFFLVFDSLVKILLLDERYNDFLCDSFIAFPRSIYA